MKKIFVPTNTRGFLTNLFDHDFQNIEFIYNKNNSTDKHSNFKRKLSNLVRSPIGDYLGIIQRINVNKTEVDMYYSYNRFLKSNKDYVIFLENPLALVHYSTERPKRKIGKKKLKKYFNDPHLKAIICMSKACFDTLPIIYDIPNTLKVFQVYPYIKNENLQQITDKIENKKNTDRLNCLYISSDFKLKGGEDVLATFKRIEKNNIGDIKLDIITDLNNLPPKLKSKINELSNVTLHDFTFNAKELNNIYIKTDVLLNPTRQDSFSLTVLEAIKKGTVVISTDLYAIPEMVKEGKNGFLTQPKYRFFNYNNLPNEHVWNNRKKTIYSDYIDKHIIDFMYEKITFLYKNPDILKEMQQYSYELSNNENFGENNIEKKWEKIFLYT